MKETIRKNHDLHFNKKPSKTYFAPATIQILGEGSDVLKGKVMMLTLSKGIYASVSDKEELQLDIQMDFMSEQYRLLVDLTNLNQETNDIYAKRVIALIKKLQYEGYPVQKGLNISITPSQTLPKNLGLHATFDMMIMYILATENAFDITDMKQIRYAYSIEKALQGNHHVNIAQHIACALGKKNQMMMVDTKTLHYEYLPFDAEHYRYVHVFINRPKFILNSDITIRLKGIQKATEQLNAFRTIDTLVDLSFEDFKRLKAKLKGSDIIRFAEHVMFEQMRIEQALDYLKQKDMIMFGDTLDQSQNSLKHLYEISNSYYDAIISQMLNQGSIGARLSQIGYDQIVIALFEKTDTPHDDDFKEAFYKQYKKELDIQPIALSQGMHIIT